MTATATQPEPTEPATISGRCMRVRVLLGVVEPGARERRATPIVTYIVDAHPWAAVVLSDRPEVLGLYGTELGAPATRAGRQLEQLVRGRCATGTWLLGVHIEEAGRPERSDLVEPEKALELLRDAFAGFERRVGGGQAPPADRFGHLPVVGHGPKFRDAGKINGAQLAYLDALAVGDSVDVLLDDGRIVRCVLRHRTTTVGSSPAVWLEGISGSYAAGRARVVGGWLNTPGCRYLRAKFAARRSADELAEDAT